MGTKVTLTIPDYIYRQAQEIAQLEQRPLAEVFNQALTQFFPAVHVSPQRERMEQEQTAFRRLHTSLLSQYPDEFVAIFEGQVIDHDQDKLALVSRIDEAFPDKVVLVKRVTSNGDKDLHMRSPRLVKDY